MEQQHAYDQMSDSDPRQVSSDNPKADASTSTTSRELNGSDSPRAGSSLSTSDRQIDGSNPSAVNSPAASLSAVTSRGPEPRPLSEERGHSGNDQARLREHVNLLPDEDDIAATHRHSKSEGCVTVRSPTSVWSFLRAWRWEILAASTAVGLLIAQFILLFVYSGKQTSSWQAPIGLNTLIAALSTIARISLVSTVSEIISQLQWIRSRDAIPLSDLEALNQASRGVWGSTKMLLLGKTAWRRPELVMTLVIALLSTGMGPFAQQAVQITECPYRVKSGTATLANIRTIGDLGKTVLDGSEWLQTSVARATVNLLSLFDLDGKANTSLPTTCPTGNCTFPSTRDTDGSVFTHRSLGFCSRCIDASSQIKHTELTLESDAGLLFGPNETFRGKTNIWRVPWDLEVLANQTDLLQGSENLTAIEATLIDLTINFLSISTWDIKNPLTAADLSWRKLPDTSDFLETATRFALIMMTFLSIDDVNQQQQQQIIPSEDMFGNKTSVSASICALYPCLRRYHAHVDSGKLTESFVSKEKLDIRGLHLPMNGSTPEEGCTHWRSFELLTASTPCLVDGEVYTAENISSAPNAITLSRWDYGDGKDEEVCWDDSQPSLILNKTGEVNITAPLACIYGMDLGAPGWWWDVKSRLHEALRGSCTLFGPQVQSDKPCMDTDTSEVALSSLWLDGFALLPNRSHVELESYLDRISESLTSELRRGTIAASGREMPNNSWRADAAQEWVVGDAWQTATCFSVNMSWLLLSTGVTALTVVVLAWMIIRGPARGDVVWKSSILPLVYYRDRVTVVHQEKGAVGVPAPEEMPLMWDRAMEKDSRLIQVKARFARDDF